MKVDIQKIIQGNIKKYYKIRVLKILPIDVEKSYKNKKLLSIKNLKTYFYIDRKVVKAVDGIDFSINKNEILGIVGESGSGKSVTALSILRLLPPEPSCTISGKIFFNNKNLLGLNERQMQRIRGAEISMIFQEPSASLNPVLTIGKQIAETIHFHQKLDKQKTKEKVLEILELVKISDPAKRINEYPHEMSGGMKQRVMIAMALSCNPALLIADEPTTALDVTTQKQILFLIKELQKKLKTSVLFISHNLGVIAEIADRVMVVYAGKILEQAPINNIFYHPGHPYTISLLKSIPRLDSPDGVRLKVIPGTLPNPEDSIKGCLFHPRCEFVKGICRNEEPDLIEIGKEHTVRCWMYQKKKFF